MNACQNGSWHLHLDPFDPKTGELGMPLRVPFKCHSWRHQGDCRRWIAAQNFSRITAALKPLQPRNILLAVLTLRPSEWRDRWEAFEQLSACWRQLRKKIKREFGDNDWVATVEIHKSGWPHLNVVIVNPLFAQTAPKHRLAWLKKNAVLAGFGPMATIEVAKSKQAVAGYVVKVAGETDSGAPRSTVGEVAKISQLPVNAPPHFRRLRSSVRFLPPAKKGNASMIGHLERSPLPSPLGEKHIDQPKVANQPIVAKAEIVQLQRQPIAPIQQFMDGLVGVDVLDPRGRESLPDR